MKVRNLLCAGLSGLLAASAWAAPPANDQARAKQQPQGQQLPPGHPQIPAETGKPALPPGHPQLPGNQGGGGGGGGGAGSLPPGHPQIPANGANQPKGPAATQGTLFVRAFQATAGAPAVGEEPVSVELHHQGQVIQRLEGTLDKKGTVVFNRLPLARRFQPVVRVAHAGVTYLAVGDVMDGYHAGQQVELPVYEATDAEPQWSVQARQVIVESVAEGARVTEVIALENPTDRSWLGAPRADGKRQTVTLSMPEGADQFRFGGGGEGSVKVEQGKLINTLPLMPGASEIQFSYLVPKGDDGKVRVRVVSPKLVKSLMLFVIDPGTAVAVEGVQSNGSHEMGPQGKALMYGGNDLKEGHTTLVTFTPAAATAAPGKKQQADAGGSDAPAAGGGAGGVAKAVAGVGGGVGLVLGAGYVLLKPPAKTQSL